MDAFFDIAVVSPTPTAPIDFGNRKRVNEVCRALRARGARIHFIYLPLETDWRTGIPEKSYAEMKETWDSFHIVPPSADIHRPPVGDDYTIDEWWDPSLDVFLDWFCARQPLDAVIVNYVYLSRALLHARPQCLKVLDTHDRVSGRREKLAKLDIPPEWFHTTNEEEAVGIFRADVVLAIKPEENAYFSALAGPRVVTIPFIESRRSPPVHASGSDGLLRIGIMGAFNNINIRSAIRFLQKALPRFRDHLAPVHIVLGGTMCAGLAAYKGLEGIEILGPVADMGSFYSQIDVMVVPIDESTGQKIRVGEALGFGMGIISTAHAFEGYQPAHPWHQLPSTDAVIDACIELAFEPSKLDGLRLASRESQSSQATIALQAFDDLVGLVARKRVSHLFIIDSDSLSRSPLFAAHVHSMVLFAARHAKILIVLEGKPSKSCLPLLEKVKSIARLWATGEVAIELVDCGIRHVEHVSRLLAQFRVSHVWHFGRSETALQISGQTQIVMTHASWEEKHFPNDGSNMFDWQPGLIRLCHDVSEGSVTHRRAEGAFSLPYFVPTVFDAYRQIARSRSKLSIAILVDHANARYAAFLATMLGEALEKLNARKASGQRNSEWSILLVASDFETIFALKAALSKDQNRTVPPAIVEVEEEDALTYRFGLAINLAGGKQQFALFREFLHAEGVALFLGLARVGAQNGLATSKPGHLGFLTDVLTLLDDPAACASLASRQRRWSEAKHNITEFERHLVESDRWMMLER